MIDLLNTLLNSKNSSDTSTILKLFDVRFRGDYVMLIDYLVSQIRQAQLKIDELNYKIQAKPLTLNINNPVNVKIIKEKNEEEIEVL